MEYACASRVTGTEGEGSKRRRKRLAVANPVRTPKQRKASQQGAAEQHMRHVGLDAAPKTTAKATASAAGGSGWVLSAGRNAGGVS